ncbi:MAG: transposase, partial [Gammaproteobacteria bacterium]
FGQGPGQVRRGIAVLLAGEDLRLSTMARALVLGLQAELRDLDERIKHYDARVKATCVGDVRSVKVQALPGIGPLTATALVAAVNDGKQFQNGRQMAANFGLRASTQAAGNNGSWGSPNAATPTCVPCSSTERARCYGTRRVRPTGSRVGRWRFKPDAVPMSPPWRWPTNSCGSPGRCWPAIGNTGRIGRSNRFDARREGFESQRIR